MLRDGCMIFRVPLLTCHHPIQLQTINLRILSIAEGSLQIILAALPFCLMIMPHTPVVNLSELPSNLANDASTNPTNSSRDFHLLQQSYGIWHAASSTLLARSAWNRWTGLRYYRTSKYKVSREA